MHPNSNTQVSNQIAPAPSSMVMESVQRVQRGLEITRNTRIAPDEIQRAPFQEQQNQSVGQLNAINSIEQQYVNQGRPQGLPPLINNLSTPQHLNQAPPPPFEYVHTQNVVNTASRPVGISTSRADLVSDASSDESSVHTRRARRKHKKHSSHQKNLTFSVRKLLIIVQIIFIFLFSVFVNYGDEASSKSVLEAKRGPNRDVRVQTSTIAYEDTLEYHATDYTRLQNYYAVFQDVHVMIFVGFGFLMTFLKKYGYSAVGYNMLIGAIAIQWAILCRGAFEHGFGTIPVNIQNLINGDFAAASVLITFGAVLGVTNPLQLVVITLIEVFLYALNEHIGIELFGAVDIGGSMIIHAFGAYFGLALSWTLRRDSEIKNTKNEEATATTDVFAMIGTVFLWLFWPSFNGALAVGDDQHRAVINTVLSLSACCVVSFGISALCNKDNKFNMVHIQNATLAGGVAIGATADLMVRPFGALLIGSGAGLLSTLGYVYVTPFLKRTIGLHDTCGVHNLHGMPGVLAGLISILMAAIATESEYGQGLYLQYPERSPPENSSDFREMQSDFHLIQPGSNRSAQAQALYQLATLGVTLGIGLVGGALTGLLLRFPFFGKVPDEHLFDDSRHWEVPEDEEDPKHGKEHSDGNVEMTAEKVL